MATHGAAQRASEWDQGATGPANRINLITEERGEVDPVSGKIINPNGVKGVRRVDMLEVWHRRGVISSAGYNAAEKLRDAYEGTLRAGGWPDSERVQSSPKPDMAVTIQIDRLSRYHTIARHIPQEDRPLIMACVLHQQTPAAAGYQGRRYRAGLEALGSALDRFAARLV